MPPLWSTFPKHEGQKAGIEMKFRDPKTGEVFEDIEKARIAYCVGRDCNTDCRIAFKRPTCNCWAKDQPAEAARLMGYEVVEDDSCKNRYHYAGNNICGLYYLDVGIDPDDKCVAWKEGEEPMDKKDKPLGEWTLRELQTYCRTTDCDRCIFPSGHPEITGCAMAGNPTIWELDDKPRFTEEEVADAEEIRRVFGREDSIKRTDDGVLCYGHIILNSSLLPTLRPGQAVSLQDIIKENGK